MRRSKAPSQIGKYVIEPKEKYEERQRVMVTVYFCFFKSHLFSSILSL